MQHDVLEIVTGGRSFAFGMGRGVTNSTHNEKLTAKKGNAHEQSQETAIKASGATALNLGAAHLREGTEPNQSHVRLHRTVYSSISNELGGAVSMMLELNGSTSSLLGEDPEDSILNMWRIHRSSVVPAPYWWESER